MEREDRGFKSRNASRMPLFNLICPTCATKSRVFAPRRGPGPARCDGCDVFLERDPNPPGSVRVERIDRGGPRVVERPVDSAELLRARNRDHEERQRAAK